LLGTAPTAKPFLGTLSSSQFDSDSVPFGGENPQPVRAWAAGREFDV